ncbi:MAG TPA: DUF3667 domain-containing protein [Burkholderiaceae bacterium]|nr:DUF3667 domain-containing protein [Burkholderiaceae bacterium]
MDRSVAPALTCPNCDASLQLEPPPRYCPQCGQRTESQAPGWRGFAAESFGRWRRSIVAIVGHPGLLTREHIAGRRARYVPPLRLYLVASFVFFAVTRLFDSGDQRVMVIDDGDLPQRPVAGQRDDAAKRAEAIAALRRCEAPTGRCSWSEAAGARIGVMALEQASDPRAMTARFFGMAPNAVFLLLPAFAALLMLAYRTRRWRYGTHFVFSLHMHSAWFLALTALGALPAWATALGAPIVPSVYAVWAMQSVYRGRRWATALRALAIGVCYLVALAAVMTGLGIATVLTG